MAEKRRRQGPIVIGETEVPPDSRLTVDLPLGRLSTHTQVTLPVQVIRGKRSGPRLLVCAAIHGDEVNGVEIIRRLLRMPALERLRGTLIAVPIVNVYGFLNYSRYLPDRRDLNRSFPGSASGSLASQLAHAFQTEVLSHATHGIDLHTGAIHRANLPQVRGVMEDEKVRTMMEAFGAPIMLDAPLREGSMREAAMAYDIPVMVYEAGEALRFDEYSIRTGLNGIVNVLRALDMIRRPSRQRMSREPVVARSSYWVRAPGSGILRRTCRPGQHVAAGQSLGVIADPLGQSEEQVTATEAGIVIGHSNLPMTNQGDALIHIARVRNPLNAAERIEAFQDVLIEEKAPADGAAPPPEEPVT